MGIVNKRNAVLGWMTWKVGKGMARRKVKVSMPGRSHHSGHKRKPAILAGIAAALGITALLKRKRKGGESEG